MQDVTDDNAPHTIAGFIAFGSAGPAALALARRLSRDPRWADLARYVRVVGVVLLLLFLALGVLARPVGAPLHDSFGLSQWIFLGVWFPCLAALAVRLFRTS
jgi:nitrate/nitrite transporter NarK